MTRGQRAGNRTRRSSLKHCRTANRIEKPGKPNPNNSPAVDANETHDDTGSNDPLIGASQAP